MTREKVLQIIENMHGNIHLNTKAMIKQLINEIYDDFESRVCGNCEHFNNFYKTCRMGYAFCIATKKVREDFGCNKFKRKRDESIQI